MYYCNTEHLLPVPLTPSHLEKNQLYLYVPIFSEFVEDKATSKTSQITVKVTCTTGNNMIAWCKRQNVFILIYCYTVSEKTNECTLYIIEPYRYANIKKYVAFLQHVVEHS
jgi:hypothetical protein